MMPTFDQLTARQQRGMTALCLTATVQAAAKQCHVPAHTLYRWLRDPAFQTVYRQARHEFMTEAFAAMQKGCTRAVAALFAALEDEAASVRLTAAKTILDLAMKARSIEELEARVAALEQLGPPAEAARPRLASVGPGRPPST
jgi:hypothetical protein